MIYYFYRRRTSSALHVYSGYVVFPFSTERAPMNCEALPIGGEPLAQALERIQRRAGVSRRAVYTSAVAEKIVEQLRI